jgi:hypothetical protein
MTYVFFFACAVFACNSKIHEGDGKYYSSKPLCLQAARKEMERRHLKPHSWTIECAEREQPK